MMAWSKGAVGAPHPPKPCPTQGGTFRNSLTTKAAADGGKSRSNDPDRRRRGLRRSVWEDSSFDTRPGDVLIFASTSTTALTMRANQHPSFRLGGDAGSGEWYEPQDGKVA